MRNRRPEELDNEMTPGTIAPKQEEKPPESEVQMNGEVGGIICVEALSDRAAQFLAAHASSISQEVRCKAAGRNELYLVQRNKVEALYQNLVASGFSVEGSFVRQVKPNIEGL